MIEYLPIVLTGIGIIVAIIYYTLTLRNAHKTQQMQLETRQAQMFMQIYNQSCDPKFTEAYHILMKHPIKSYDEYSEKQDDQEFKSAENIVGMFYEGLGVFVKEGYVSIKLVALLMTGMTRRWWEGVYKSYIDVARIEMNFPRFMSESEYLYNNLMKYLETHPELAT